MGVITADRLVRADQVPDLYRLCLLLYGQPGVGKTTLAATMADVPGAGPVLLVDVDGGSRSISHRRDVTIFRPTSWADFTDVYDTAQAGEFKTVIIDTLSEAGRLCMDMVLGTGKRAVPLMNDDTNDYTQVNERVMRLVRRFRGLTTSPGVHVLFTTWEIEQEIKKGDNINVLTRIRPDLSAKLNIGVRSVVDSIGRLSWQGGKRVLTLRTHGNTITAKLRVPPGVTVPDTLENPTMPDLLAFMQRKDG
jgi:phage nucleotide-binding protein